MMCFMSALSIKTSISRKTYFHETYFMGKSLHVIWAALLFLKYIYLHLDSNSTF